MNVVLPLGLLLGVVSFVFQDRKAPEATIEGRPAAVASVAHVQTPSRALPAVDVARAVESAPAVTAKASVPIDPNPIPAAAVEGTLLVESNPPGAFITVNGIGRGKTPVKVEFLAFGSYTIRVVQPGYQVSEQHMTLDSENPRKTVKVNLRPVDQPAQVEGGF